MGPKNKIINPVNIIVNTTRSNQITTNSGIDIGISVAKIHGTVPANIIIDDTAITPIKYLVMRGASTTSKEAIKHSASDKEAALPANNASGTLKTLKNG